MGAPSRWGMTPEESVRHEADRRGAASVVAGCVDLLRRRDVDPELIYALGGAPARWAVTGDESGPDYWLRVWAARGLLWLWDDTAADAAMDALTDEHWRVREMAIRVCARHRLDYAMPQIVACQDDDHARVRTAAARALARLVG